ncbi:MAG TPA: heme o synthase [Polyangiaceae bacterium]|nr:heme o synthase [Polyangiaceae bacterium]
MPETPAQSAALPLAEAPERTGTFGALVELTKPSIAALVMVTATCGALVAGGHLPLGRLLVALVATTLVVGAANALNMYAERDSDALMRRTQKRPLPSGRLGSEVALGFGLLTASIGLNVLGVVAGGLACALTALAFASYVFVYTPLKRVTPHALVVGALPGALPPLIGYAAVRGTLGLPALFLFAVLFVWQMPHFLAIALFLQEDYRKGGMQVYSVARGPERTVRAMRWWTVVLLLVTLLPALGTVHLGYFAVAVPAGLAFATLVFRVPPGLSRVHWARRVFFASMPYLVVVYAAYVAAA